jgi:ribonuclease P protein component
VSQKLIDELFSNSGSQSMVAFPVRVVYRVKELNDALLSPDGSLSPLHTSLSSPHAQVLISVPKRHLHHAVDRNRVKRQLRDAWRHHRQPLLDALPEDKHLLVSFVWLSDRLYESREVAARVEKLIRRIASRL